MTDGHVIAGSGYSRHIDIPTLTPEYAQTLVRPRGGFVDGGPDTVVIDQVGAARIALSTPISWPDLTPDEATIDMFIVEPDGSMLPTGDDADIVEKWRPAATSMYSQLCEGLAAAGVRITGTAYLTASATPGPDVSGVAHFDEDRFEPDSSPGFVAILGSLAGAHIATTPLELRCAARPGTPLLLDDAEIAAFDRDDLPRQTATADELIVFPQFAQFHAGPGPQPAGQHRHLLVLRTNDLDVDAVS